MMKLFIFVLFISSFSHASSYFWSCGATVGSRYFWDRGVEAGSSYYWEKGDGPGSRYYWENGTGYGSKYYYLKNDGPWSNFSYHRGTGPGSYYFWNSGQGPGSRYFYEESTKASSDGVIIALCMNNSIVHPLCESIRYTPNRLKHYCTIRNLNTFDNFQRSNAAPLQKNECIEPSGF